MTLELLSSGLRKAIFVSHFRTIFHLNIHWVSQVLQWVKNLPAMQEMQETWVLFQGCKDPLEEGMATHSSIIAWRMDKGAWWAAVYRVTTSRTWLKRLSAHARVLNLILKGETQEASQLWDAAQGVAEGWPWTLAVDYKLPSSRVKRWAITGCVFIFHDYNMCLSLKMAIYPPHWEYELVVWCQEPPYAGLSYSRKAELPIPLSKKRTSWPMNLENAGCKRSSQSLPRTSQGSLAPLCAISLGERPGWASPRETSSDHTPWAGCTLREKPSHLLKSGCPLLQGCQGALLWAVKCHHFHSQRVLNCLCSEWGRH